MMSNTPIAVRRGGAWLLVGVLAVLPACSDTSTPESTVDTAADVSQAEDGGEPGFQLSALAPENLKRERPPAPFDLTGNWFIDTKDGADPEAWRFGPP